MVTQQGTQRIEVIIRKDSSGLQGAKSKTADEFASDGGSSGNTRTRKDKWRRARMIKTNATHAVSAGLQLWNMAFSFSIGGIGMQTGDQALEQHYRRTWEVVEDTTGFAMNVARGAIFGAWGGAPGIVIGTLIAAATSSASIGLKYENRQREFNYKIFKENNAIEYKRARANINMTNGRLR